MAQKAIVTKVVGKAMSQLGVDHPDYEKDKRESQDRLTREFERCSRRVAERDFE